MCQSTDSLSTLGLNRESSEWQPSATLDDVSSYSNVAWGCCIACAEVRNVGYGSMHVGEQRKSPADDATLRPLNPHLRTKLMARQVAIVGLLILHQRTRRPRGS